MRLHNGRTTLFRHINGMDGQFILLENHPSWMPVNDADFNHAAPLPDGLAVHEESFYPFEKIDAESADNIKIFSEEALRLEKERLNAAPWPSWQKSSSRPSRSRFGRAFGKNGFSFKTRRYFQ